MNQPPSSENDIQAAQTPTIVRAGGGVVLGAAALVLLVVAQTFSGFTLSATATGGLGLLGLLGAGAATAGVLLMRARAGSALFALVASVLLFVAATAWLLFSASGGLLSLFALLAPPLSLVGLGLSAASMGPCRRVAEARGRLAAQGLDLGT